MIYFLSLVVLSLVIIFHQSVADEVFLNFICGKMLSWAELIDRNREKKILLKKLPWVVYLILYMRLLGKLLA